MRNMPPVDKGDRFKRIGAAVLKLLLGAVAIWVILTKVDISKVGDILKGADKAYLLLGFVCFLVSKFFAAVRINRYYRSRGLFLPEIQNYLLSLAANFYNLLIPLVGGEGFKVYWVRKHHDVALKDLVWSALLDRGSGLLLLLVLAMGLSPLTGIASDHSMLLLTAIPLLIGAHWVIHRTFFRRFHEAWLKVNLFSLLVQLFQMVTVLLIIRGLHVHGSALDYLFVFMLSTLAYMLPFVGARELLFVLGSEQLGLDKDLSLAIGVVFYLTMAANSLLGLYFMVDPSPLKKQEVS